MKFFLVSQMKKRTTRVGGSETLGGLGDCCPGPKMLPSTAIRLSERCQTTHHPTLDALESTGEVAECLEREYSAALSVVPSKSRRTSSFLYSA